MTRLSARDYSIAVTLAACLGAGQLQAAEIIDKQSCNAETDRVINLHMSKNLSDEKTARVDLIIRDLQSFCRREAFGPVAVISSFSSFDAALKEVNNSVFGLQTGIFTRDIYKANKAWDTLEVGGVIIGDVPSWRADQMPYGGVKNSGLGREGLRWAIEEMTEVRMLAIRTPPA